LAANNEQLLFCYDGSWPGDLNPGPSEPVEIEDIISLLDLILVAEITCFSLMANDINCGNE
jgi:hypothetical protein